MFPLNHPCQHYLIRAGRWKVELNIFTITQFSLSRTQVSLVRRSDKHSDPVEAVKKLIPWGWSAVPFCLFKSENHNCWIIFQIDNETLFVWSGHCECPQSTQCPPSDAQNKYLSIHLSLYNVINEFKSGFFWSTTSSFLLVRIWVKIIPRK